MKEEISLRLIFQRNKYRHPLLTLNPNNYLKKLLTAQLLPLVHIVHDMLLNHESIKTFPINWSSSQVHTSGNQLSSTNPISSNNRR